MALDFDDNRMTCLSQALPVMAKHGFVGTVPTITQMAETGQLEDYSHLPALRWEHCRELRDAGWLITPHSVTHSNTMDSAGAIAELAASRDAVARRMGESAGAQCFTYPGALGHACLDLQ